MLPKIDRRSSANYQRLIALPSYFPFLAPIFCGDPAMLFRSWLRESTKREPRLRHRHAAFRPRLETLEPRAMLSAGAGPHILDVGPSFKYATIQAAVNDAKPFDTVQIHSGTYSESVVVATPHLTLIGAPRSN